MQPQRDSLIPIGKSSSALGVQIGLAWGPDSGRDAL